jgi:lipopolysaccharide/colanic/teichoic acid biosynthesis glycosyltransferase
MTASDGYVVGTGLVTDLQWETAYNTLLIPYERSIKSTVAYTLQYLQNLTQWGDTSTYFRTCTLNFAGTSI